MLVAIASALLLSNSPANIPVEVGRFDPAKFPELELRERRLPDGAMVHRVENILEQGRCKFEGQSVRRFDIRVPYVVQLEPSGTPTKVVIADVGCAPLEYYVGTMVRELARVGDFRPTGEAGPQWYSSEARFIVQ